MAAGRRDFQGALDALLPFHFGEIHFVVVVLVEDVGEVHFGGRDFYFAFEKLRGFAQVLDGNDLEAGDDGSFGRVVGGDEHADLSIGFGAEGDGQNTFAGADGAGEREFADDDEIIELVSFDLFAGGEHADGDGEIETGAFFFDVGGREVDGGAAHGEFEGGIGEGGGDAILGFAHGGVREADDDDFSLAPAGIYFDFDGERFNAVDGSRTNLGQHADVMGEFRRDCNLVFGSWRREPPEKIIFCGSELVGFSRIYPERFGWFGELGFHIPELQSGKILGLSVEGIVTEWVRFWGGKGAPRL